MAWKMASGKTNLNELRFLRHLNIETHSILKIVECLCVYVYGVASIELFETISVHIMNTVKNP